MDISIIFEMLNDVYIQKYRKELKKNETDPLAREVQKSYSILEKELNGEQLKLVKSHIHYNVLLEEWIDMLLGTKILNYGIKIGMQLKEQFDEMD